MPSLHSASICVCSVQQRKIRELVFLREEKKPSLFNGETWGADTLSGSGIMEGTFWEGTQLTQGGSCLRQQKVYPILLDLPSSD